MFGATVGFVTGVVTGSIGEWQRTEKLGLARNARMIEMMKAAQKGTLVFGGFFTIYQGAKCAMEVQRKERDMLNVAAGVVAGTCVVLPLAGRTLLMRQAPYLVETHARAST